jgi:hypothetical protein
MHAHCCPLACTLLEIVRMETLMLLVTWKGVSGVSAAAGRLVEWDEWERRRRVRRSSHLYICAGMTAFCHTISRM